MILYLAGVSRPALTKRIIYVVSRLSSPLISPSLLALLLGFPVGFPHSLFHWHFGNHVFSPPCHHSVRPVCLFHENVRAFFLVGSRGCSSTTIILRLPRSHSVICIFTALFPIWIVMIFCICLRWELASKKKGKCPSDNRSNSIRKTGLYVLHLCGYGVLTSAFGFRPNATFHAELCFLRP